MAIATHVAAEAGEQHECSQQNRAAHGGVLGKYFFATGPVRLREAYTTA